MNILIASRRATGAKDLQNLDLPLDENPFATRRALFLTHHHTPSSSLAPQSIRSKLLFLVGYGGLEVPNDVINNMIEKPSSYRLGELITKVLESAEQRINLSAMAHPAVVSSRKEIRLKMNLPDHRSVLTDQEDQAKMEMETPHSSRVNSPPNARSYASKERS
ncbi:hypothetical protein Tco_0880846 [Tanacetum coccineum]